jgi:hypothetical protein
MVLPLTITVAACLVIVYLTRPIALRYVDDETRPGKLEIAGLLSLLAAIIVGGWSAFVLVTIGLKNWIA